MLGVVGFFLVDAYACTDPWVCRSRPCILFYFVFGLFKIAGIIQQIYYRYQKGHTKDPRFKELDKGVKLLGTMAYQAIQKRKIDHLF